MNAFPVINIAVWAGLDAASWRLIKPRLQNDVETPEQEEGTEGGANTGRRLGNTKALRWAVPHPFTKFSSNPFSCFCKVMVTDDQTSKQTWTKTSVVEVTDRVYQASHGEKTERTIRVFVMLML